MSSSAPVSISENLNQMTLGQPRAVKEFVLHPTTLKGEGDFHDFLAYLQYLESRPEAGEISNLILEGLPENTINKLVKIRFSIIVSRIKLKKQT